MTDTRVPPNNLEAEESVLGAMLLAQPAIEDAMRILVGSDFYRPSHEHIFEAILAVHSDGAKTDVVTTADALRRAGQLEAVGGMVALIGLQSSTPAISSAARYAQIVRRDSDARKAIAVFTEATESLYKLKAPGDVVDKAQLDLEGIAHAGGTLPKTLTTYGALIDSAEEDSAWLIPGIIYDDNKIVLVATEGGGKSTLKRQIIMCASQGVDPFRPDKRIEPVRSLDCDFENPRRELRTSGKWLRSRLSEKLGGFNDDMCQLYRRKKGIDLRRRTDRLEFERVIREVRPKLLVGGPVYRMGPKKDREDLDDHALAIQLILDDMADRYGFGMILEAHSAKGNRNEGPLLPKGSQLWMSWPDLGISMRGTDTGATIERSRGDRGHYDWPTQLTKGSALPWLAVRNTSSTEGA